MGKIVDNFAGGGGVSVGLEKALGRKVDIAVNHSGEALAMHEANHPETTHYQEDVFDIDPLLVTRGDSVDLAWFSPDCKHHSRAKGGKPLEQKIRGLAWVTLRWGVAKRPKLIGLENVPEFVEWGPLGADHLPIKSEKGRTFKAFVLALTTGLPSDHPDLEEIYRALGGDFPMERLHKGLGYSVDWKTRVASDYGVPTIRKRLILLARADGRPVIWPEATHGDPKRYPDRLPWISAASCIDFSIPVKSIFNRKRPLAEKTMVRIAKGLGRYVFNNPEPYQVKGQVSFITEHANGSSQRNFDLREPMRTQCANVKGGHFGLVSAQIEPETDELVVGFLAKHFGGVVGNDYQQPFGTVTTIDHHGVVMAHLVRDFGASVGSDLNDPVGTVTAGGGGHTALAAAYMIKMRGDNVGQDLTTPLATVSAGGQHHACVVAFLMKYYGEGGQLQTLDAPLHTISTKARLALVLVRNEWYRIVDIGMRMLTPPELALAQGLPEDYILKATYNGKPLSSAAQIRMIGNSVPPELVAVHIKANWDDIKACEENHELHDMQKTHYFSA